MAFSKYDPHGPQEAEPEGTSPSAIRRARLLKYAWWISTVYTAIGFVFLGLFLFGVFP